MGRGTLAAEDTIMPMIGTKPHEEEEIWWDQDEMGRARALSLVGTPPIVVCLPSRPAKVLASCSICAKLIVKQAESWDPSFSTFFIRPIGTSFEEQGIPFPLLDDIVNNKEKGRNFLNEWISLVWWRAVLWSPNRLVLKWIR